MNEEEKESYIEELDVIPLEAIIYYMNKTDPRELLKITEHSKDVIDLVKEIYQLKRNNMNYTQSLDELIYLIIGRI